MIEIDVSRALKQQGESFHYEYTGTPELKELDFAKPLVISADYSVIDGDGEIRITGDYDAVVSLACVRCLDDVEYSIRSRFDEVFSKNVMEDDDGYVYKGETLSLDKMIYDDIILSIPQQVLCSEDCRGLCQNCGANLNRGDCGCGGKVPDDDSNPFSKLKDLF